MARHELPRDRVGAAKWGLALACLLLAGPLWAETTATPSLPPPPPPPDVPSMGSSAVAAGEVHHGHLRLFDRDVTIAGEQVGDVTFLGQSLEIPGSVKGSVSTFGQSLAISGNVTGSVKTFGASVKVSGTIGGDLKAYCGTVVLQKGSHVAGDVDANGGQVTLDGAVDGRVKAAAGEISIGGTIAKNADLRADLIRIAPDAKIAGELDYSSRERLDLGGKGIVGGEIHYYEEEGEHVEHRVHAASRSVAGRFVKWLGFMLLGLLAGLASLAVSRRASSSILAAVERDPLRNVGLGFLTFIVVPVAAVVSCILIITIPFAALVLALYALLVYLAKAPVAVWIGRLIFRKLGRPETSPYKSLAIGILVLYVLFAIPYLGWLVWFAAAFMGLGAMVFGIRDFRQARKLAAAGGFVAGGAPGAPPPPGDAPESGVAV